MYNFQIKSYEGKNIFDQMRSLKVKEFELLYSIIDISIKIYAMVSFSSVSRGLYHRENYFSEESFVPSILVIFYEMRNSYFVSWISEDYISKFSCYAPWLNEKYF